MRILTICIAMLLLPCMVTAWEGDDTLRYYMSKSDLVVAGRIVSEPIDLVHETGVTHSSFRFKVEEVLFGTRPDLQDDSFQVVILTVNTAGDGRPELLKKDSRCLLFLKNILNAWHGADRWFQVQPYNSLMIQSIKRLTAEEHEGNTKSHNRAIDSYKK